MPPSAPRPVRASRAARSGLPARLSQALAATHFALVIVTAACASAPSTPAAPTARPLAGWKRARSTEGSFTVALPGPARTKRAHEGPVRMQLFAAEGADGTVFEVAWFDMPEPLDVGEQRALMEQVMVGLTRGPGATLRDAEAVEMAGMRALHLRVDLDEDREGDWRIFYAGDRRMFQVSAVGPASPGREATVAAFFASFQLLSAE